MYPLDPPIVDVRIPVKEPHAAATAYSRSALRHQFPGAQVGDDLHMLFSEPGRTGQTRLSPDILVALNVPRRATRADYDADVLGPPDFILEVVSRSTWRHDWGRKLDCYQQIGVRECLLFDVTGENRARKGELRGYALTPANREPLGEVVLPNGERGVRSEVLGLVAYVAERIRPFWAAGDLGAEDALARSGDRNGHSRRRRSASRGASRASPGRRGAAQSRRTGGTATSVAWRDLRASDNAAGRASRRCSPLQMASSKQWQVSYPDARVLDHNDGPGVEGACHGSEVG